MKKAIGISLLLISMVLSQTNSKVLIAYEKTPYKDLLIEKVVESLKKDAVSITMENDIENNLKNYDANEYDVIFISNSGVMSKIRPWVKEWLKANKASESKILLHTTKKKEWNEKVTVDAISSASEKSNVEAKALEAVTILEKKLSVNEK